MDKIEFKRVGHDKNDVMLDGKHVATIAGVPGRPGWYRVTLYRPGERERLDPIHGQALAKQEVINVLLDPDKRTVPGEVIKEHRATVQPAIRRPDGSMILPYDSSLPEEER